MWVNGEFRKLARQVGLAGGIGLAALTLPVGAQQDVLVQMVPQVAARVSRGKPSVVSVRVGPRRNERSDAPDGPLMEIFASQATACAAKPARPARAARGATAAVPMAAAAYRNLAAGAGGNVWTLLQPARVGTGFVVDRSGFVLTTTDVVAGAVDVSVRLSDGREVSGKVLGADGPTGVAVVKVEASDLPALELAADAHPAPGQWAIVVGNQLAANSVWVGTVARTDATLGTASPQGRLLQINAPVGAGASGAPVLNSSGQVIGVVCATSNPLLRLGEADPKAAEELGKKLGAKYAALGEKVANDQELQRHVRELTRAAEQLGKKAGKHAAELAEKQEKEARKQGKDAEKLRAELEQKAREIERQMERFGDELDRKFDRLGEQLGETAGKLAEKAAELGAAQAEVAEDGKDRARREAEIGRLKAEIERLKLELKRRQEEMSRELGRLNELLPNVPGIREFSVELAPDLARVVAEAQAVTEEAVQKAIAIVPEAVSAGEEAGAAVRKADPPAEPVPAPEVAPGKAEAPEIEVKPAPNPEDVRVLAPEIHFWAGRTPGDGAVTYAIPASTVRWAAAQIRDHGRVAHPFLGVRLEDLKPEERERLKAPGEARARVADVVPNSPASEAGLQRDDLVLEFGGKKVADAADLVELMQAARPGNRVPIVVWRNGERRTIEATLRELPVRTFQFNYPSTVRPYPTPAVPFRFEAPHIAPPNNRLWRTNPPRVMRIFSFGGVQARAEGRGRNARVSLEAQDAELEAVTRELSRATGLEFSAAEGAARQHITLKVEDVSVTDLVESLERLYHLRSERRGDRISFRSR